MQVTVSESQSRMANQRWQPRPHSKRPSLVIQHDLDDAQQEEEEGQQLDQKICHAKQVLF